MDDGIPIVRGFFLPAHDWEIEDTWHVAGLRGTGSHHIKVTNAMVPAEHFFDSNGAFHASLDRSTKQCVKSFHFYMPLSISVWPKVH